MESGRKKRKMGNEEHGAGDDDEEEKMEKFFALIRSTREMRDRLRNVPNGSKEDEEEEEKKRQEKKPVAAQWNPKFQPEDFMDDSISRSENPLVLNDAGPSSKIKHEPEKEETKEGSGEDGGLDLNLSL